MPETPLIPAAVLENLAEQLYEKRKSASIEVENTVKQYAVAGEHEKIGGLINVLISDFTNYPEPNHRKGGLIGLAAATVGLSTQATPYLEKIVPPVLSCITDQDSRVRFYACEALYNIAKVVRGDLFVFAPQIYEELDRLAMDSDPNVQSTARLLNQLVKDIIAESEK
ncbi:protein VAC14 homolog [Papaver somniferum]|uniref:protein VAC14 homolog n=1 Tax=Papaver somniferum TaxID=3469 RepID=UPI000E6F5270|nr:protein VAC14 homolog [Papaver somniferum]